MIDISDTRNLTLYSLKLHDIIQDVCGTCMREKCLRPFIRTLLYKRFRLVGNLYAMIRIVWQVDAKVTPNDSHLPVFMPRVEARLVTCF